MKRHMLFASVISLLACSPASAEPTPETAPSGCASCATPVHLAQLGPVRGRPMQASEAVSLPVTGPKQGEGGAPAICCDPAMYIPINQFMSMFHDDPATGNITSNYGFTFHPTPAFVTSVNNTAFIANTLLGLPFSHFIIRAEMRTDDVAHTAFVPGTLPATFSGFGRVVQGWNQNFYVEDSPLGYVMASNANPFTLALNSPTDMVRDGRRYIVKFTYWVAYTDPRTGQWVARQVICNNVPDRYIGISKDTVGMKIGAGAPNGPIIMAEDSNGAPSGSMKFGQPVPLRSEEIEMLKKRR